MPGFKLIAWDLGGVLVRTMDQAPRRTWEQRLGLAAGELAEIVFDNPVSRQATLGLASVEDIWVEVAHRLGLSPAQAADLSQDFWRGDRLDQDLVAFIRQLHGPFKTALITNAWPNARVRIVHGWKLGEVFDEIFISAEVGLAKPDPAIYQHVLDRGPIEPAQMIFVDDFQENVDAAERMGIQGIIFRTPEQVKKDLEARLTSTAHPS
jgi:epoxide hydrolase-like predicted phosphatase